MTTKKKVVLTVLLGVLVAFAGYCLYLNIDNIVYRLKIQNMATNPAYSDYSAMYEAYSKYLYNVIESNIIISIFTLIALCLFVYLIYKLWNKKQ